MTTTETQMSGETDNVKQLKEWTPKTIGIIGSRRRKSKADYDQLYKALHSIYADGDMIVSGGCEQGGDFFAEQLARRLGTTIIIHHANWDKYGRSAGYERNGKIALDSDVLLALVANDRKGGTEDTIRKYIDLEKGNLIILETGKHPAVGITDNEPAPTPEYTPPPFTPHETPAQCPPNPSCNDYPSCESCKESTEQIQKCFSIPQKTTVVHITQTYDVYIGRRGHGQDGYFGNPHPVGKPCQACGGITHDRTTAIEAFRADFQERIKTDDSYRQKILDLRGKRLGCFCAPRACHGDIIADYLNQS